MKLPLSTRFAVAPGRAPILRYGVALLSTLLALIPTLFFADLAESRLVVFAVAVMVSAWYGGWKPGLAATSFALTVSAYYSFQATDSRRVSQGVAHLAFFSPSRCSSAGSTPHSGLPRKIFADPKATSVPSS